MGRKEDPEPISPNSGEKYLNLGYNYFIGLEENTFFFMFRCIVIIKFDSLFPLNFRDPSRMNTWIV